MMHVYIVNDEPACEINDCVSTTKNAVDFFNFFLRRSHAGQWIIKSQSDEEGEDEI